MFVTGKFSLHMENSIDVHCKNINQRYHGLLKQQWSLIALWERWHPVFRGSFGGIAELLCSKMEHEHKAKGGQRLDVYGKVGGGTRGRATDV